ncbi:hypothetical protein LSH36_1249g00109 [Paralvinella palmiformis]|uniref:Uncharacterized protein n=1 Tax=Paralvinella palmiformis TaxID=53620 RepID=A0AAD9MR57_9ANNE|nr:hypothetical protein LSH36_1249g00109 [Paralvinella palmiformis]
MGHSHQEMVQYFSISDLFTDYSQCESCDTHPFVNSHHYPHHNQSSDHGHTSSQCHTSYNLPHSQLEHSNQPNVETGQSTALVSSQNIPSPPHLNQNTTHHKQQNGHLIMPYHLTCNDSCTDSESCLDDEDQQNTTVPHVAIIPNWYPSGTPVSNRHANDLRVS